MNIRVWADVKVNIKTKDIQKQNVIYCLTFPSGKKYIGKTVQLLEKRIKDHIWGSFNENATDYNTKKARAIRKYLEISVSILYEGEDLENMEIYWINKLNTFREGYNSTEGGDGTQGKGIIIYQYTLDGEYITSYNTITEAANTTGINKRNIATAAIVTNNDRKQAGNYQWRYTKEEKIEPVKRRNRPILQYSIDMKLLNEYQTSNEAQIATGIERSQISGVCNGRRKTAGGYIWKFKEDVNNGTN